MWIYDVLFLIGVLISVVAIVHNESVDFKFHSMTERQQEVWLRESMKRDAEKWDKVKDKLRGK